MEQKEGTFLCTEDRRCECAILSGEGGGRQQAALTACSAVEDLWETLMGVHEQVCHGGRIRMEKYLVEYGSHVPRPVIQLFLDLADLQELDALIAGLYHVLPLFVEC